MNTKLPLLVLPLLVLTASVSALPDNNKPSPGQLSFFETNIRPVLVSKCYDCHSAQSKKVKGGLLLDTREGIRKGGDSGPAVVPGNPKKSLLMHAIEYKDKEKQMPPKEPLAASVVADFERWINMGAPDPRDRVASAKPAAPANPKNFWSFQPVRQSPPPAVKDAAWPRGPIDQFILATLESKGLKPVADAEKPTLLRRVYFDLIGLPPTPEDLQSFLEDSSPKAFETVVDRLLASPQFGERWGRHWLDVARYAESTGKERNFPFPDAWRYRDYVIAAFNADKPYDLFIREQIAGDLLPAKNAAERNAHLIATGFLAIGPKGLNEKNRDQFRMDEIDEQIDTTTRAVMALTVSCARCHDHKFDPFTQKDYYGIAGIFRSSETYFGVGDGDGKKNRQPSPPLNLVAADWRPSSIIAAAPPMPEPENGKKKGKKKNQAAQAAAVVVDPSVPHAMGMLDGRPSDCPLYQRGEVESPGPVVPRAFPAILNGPWAPRINPAHSGRLELATFLTRPENPLTARVMANRIWQQLFGKGLVSTSDNFGATGEPPTHPELLDHLARQFVTNDWSVKKMVRAIVLSRTYQLSSSLDAASYAVDPDNNFHWRASQRRLDAESIRDSMLAVSGELELTPPNAVESAQPIKVGGKKAKAKKKGGYAEEPGETPHRSVYLTIIRDKLPDALELFDFAEPSLVVTNRDVTTVPSQALFMMNSSFVAAQSEAMAKSLLAETSLDTAGRIRSAYLQAFLRPPTPAERARAEAYLDRTVKEFKVPADKAWVTFCQALFASAEFRYLN